jgi:hypothetical protein
LNHIGWETKLIKLLILQVYPFFLSFKPKFPSETPILEYLQSIFSLIWQTKFHTHTQQQLNHTSVYFDLLVFRWQKGRVQVSSSIYNTLVIEFLKDVLHQ